MLIISGVLASLMPAAKAAAVNPDRRTTRRVIMKKIIKYLILAVIAVVFIGTLVFLYGKSQQQAGRLSSSTARRR